MKIGGLLTAEATDERAAVTKACGAVWRTRAARKGQRSKDSSARSIKTRLVGEERSVELPAWGSSVIAASDGSRARRSREPVQPERRTSSASRVSRPLLLRGPDPLPSPAFSGRILSCLDIVLGHIRIHLRPLDSSSAVCAPAACALRGAYVVPASWIARLSPPPWVEECGFLWILSVARFSSVSNQWGSFCADPRR